MLPSKLFSEKAKELHIEIEENSGLGRMRVCKRMLTGLFSLLEMSYDEVFESINFLESELLAIKFTVEQVSKSSDMKLYLIGNDYISSVDTLVTNVRLAYNAIYAASRRLKDSDKLQAYLDMCECFDKCKDAIGIALQAFDEAV